jgi:hypothetical protein
MTIFWEHLFLISLLCFLRITRRKSFSFLPFYPAEVCGAQQKIKKFSSANSASLANLPEADKAGGE